jgi:hypothetical protein
VKADLGPVLTIPQVAKLAGWSYDRMLAHLLAMNRECNGMLLVNVGRGASRPRWTVTLSALQSVSPQWFQDPEELRAILEDHSRRLRRLEAIVDLHTVKLSKTA